MNFTNFCDVLTSSRRRPRSTRQISHSESGEARATSVAWPLAV
jgi:hypothetical protein